MTRGYPIAQQRALRVSGRSLARTVIPEDVVYRWPLNEGSGTAPTDTIEGVKIQLNFEHWSSDDLWFGGHAVQFNGMDEHGSAVINPPAGDMTMAVTLEWAPEKSDVETAWGFGGPQAGARRVWANGPDNSIAFGPRNDSDEPFDVSWKPPSADRYRIVAVLDISRDFEAKLFVNNELQATEPLAGTWNETVSDMQVGSSAATNLNRYYQGHLDNLILSDKSWSQNRIEFDYARQPWA